MLELVRLDRMPFMGPFIGGRCGGTEDMRGGGWPTTDAGGESFGLLWFTMLTWWIIVYRVWIRGTGTFNSAANLIGDPRKLSISIGRRSWKSWNMVLGASAAAIFSIVLSRKSLGKEQPLAFARSTSSSMTPVTN